MARNIELLLTENVDNLGIVGDVVKVRTGYARNYLMPRQLATQPSEEAIKALTAKRAEAERQMSELRKVREGIIERLNGHELHLIRSCNDLGVLYAGITQQEIAKALTEAGFGVKPRDVRLPHAIKRIDTYEVHVKFESDLEAVIKLWIMPDRKLEPTEKKDDMEFDNEGNLVAPGSRRRRDRDAAESALPPAPAPAAEPVKGSWKTAAVGAPEKPAKGEKADKHPKGEKSDKGEKGEKPHKGDKSAKAEKGEKHKKSKGE